MSNYLTPVETHFLDRLIKDEYEANDVFWDELLDDLAKQYIGHRNEVQLDSYISLIGPKIVKSNEKFRHVCIIVDRLTQAISEFVNASVTLPGRGRNEALLEVHLFLVESIFKYFIAHMPPSDLHFHLEGDKGASDGQEIQYSRSNRLVSAVLGLLLKTPITVKYYGIHTMALTLLLVMSSTQVVAMLPEIAAGSPAAATAKGSGLKPNPLLEDICIRSKTAPHLLAYLLHGFSLRMESPYEVPVAGSKLKALAKGFSGLFGRRAAKEGPEKDGLSGMETVYEIEASNLDSSPLSTKCLLFLSILVNYVPSRKEGAEDALNVSELKFANCFWETFASIRDESDVTEGSDVDPAPVSYEGLMHALARVEFDGRALLLLYLLLYRNRSFLNFFEHHPLAVNVTVSLLRLLFRISDLDQDTANLAAIVALLLSQSASFMSLMGSKTLEKVPWYRRRDMTNISVQSLVVCVIIRALQFNMARLKDSELANNCFAALANVCPQSTNLHLYAAQRIMSLVSILKRRIDRLAARPAHSLEVPKKETRDAPMPVLVSLEEDGNNRLPPLELTETSRMLDVDTELPADAAKDILQTVDDELTIDFEATVWNRDGHADEKENLQVHCNFLQLTLDSIASVLQRNLKRNQQLAYAVLHGHGIVRSMREPAFLGTLSAHSLSYETIARLTKYLEDQVVFLENAVAGLDVAHTKPAEIQEVLSAKIQSMPQNKSAPPVPAFQYQEDEDPHDFFVPYVWRLIRLSSGIAFPATLFSTRPPEEVVDELQSTSLPHSPSKAQTSAPTDIK